MAAQQYGNSMAAHPIFVVVVVVVDVVGEFQETVDIDMSKSLLKPCFPASHMWHWNCPSAHLTRPHHIPYNSSAVTIVIQAFV